MTDRILTLQSVEKVSEKLRKDDKKIILVGGCFDILHNGHLHFLKNAKKLGDVLFVLLESDTAIKKTKGDNRPINSQSDRAEMLAELRDVDFVVLLPHLKTDREYDEVINMIKPAIIATTKGDPGIQHKQRQAKLIGGRVAEITAVKNKSTSAVAALLAKEL